MKEVITTIVLIASFCTAVGVIIGVLKKAINKVLAPLTNTINGMDERQCRMWLVDFLNDVDNGVPKDEVQFKFAHEVYDHYTNDLHKNSYIHDKWDRVMKK